MEGLTIPYNIQMIEELFVPYDLSLELKKIGYDINCLGYYTSDGELESTSSIYQENHQVYSSFLELNNTTLLEDLIDIHGFSETDNEDKYCVAPSYNQIRNWFEKIHKLSLEVSFNTSDGLWKGIIISMEAKSCIYFNSNKDYYVSLNDIIKNAISIITK